MPNQLALGLGIGLQYENNAGGGSVLPTNILLWDSGVSDYFTWDSGSTDYLIWS